MEEDNSHPELHERRVFVVDNRVANSTYIIAPKKTVKSLKQVAQDLAPNFQSYAKFSTEPPDNAALTQSYRIIHIPLKPIVSFCLDLGLLYRRYPNSEWRVETLGIAELIRSVCLYCSWQIASARKGSNSWARSPFTRLHRHQKYHIPIRVDTVIMRCYSGWKNLASILSAVLTSPCTTRKHARIFLCQKRRPDEDIQKRIEKMEKPRKREATVKYRN